MTTLTDPQPATEHAARRERLYGVVAVIGLVALGVSFWVANGTRTFGELMLGAFSWCF